MARNLRVEFTGAQYDKKFDRVVEQELSYWAEVGDYLTTDSEIKLMTKAAKSFGDSGSNVKVHMYGHSTVRASSAENDYHLFRVSLCWVYDNDAEGHADWVEVRSQIGDNEVQVTRYSTMKEAIEEAVILFLKS